MKKINTRIGAIFTWYDYIKPRKNKVTNITTYNQSNTKLDKHSQRYVGLFMDHNDNIYVAVAVNKKNDSGNWWRFIIENRISKVIKNGGNIDERDKGITMVPFRYKDYLFKDAHTYQNLYGLIDPTYLDMAVREAVANNSRLVDAYDYPKRS